MIAPSSAAPAIAPKTTFDRSGAPVEVDDGSDAVADGATSSGEGRAGCSVDAGPWLSPLGRTCVPQRWQTSPETSFPQTLHEATAASPFVVRLLPQAIGAAPDQEVLRSNSTGARAVI